MRRLSVAVGIVVALSAPAFSQCSVLAVSGSINPGETITVAVGGATPDAMTFLFASSNAGSTTFNFGPLGNFTVGLGQPLIFLPIGMTDSSGSLAFSVSIPANAPAPQPGTLILQAVTADFVFGGG